MHIAVRLQFLMFVYFHNSVFSGFRSNAYVIVNQLIIYLLLHSNSNLNFDHIPRTYIICVLRQWAMVNGIVSKMELSTSFQICIQLLSNHISYTLLA